MLGGTIKLGAFLSRIVIKSVNAILRDHVS